MSCCCVLRLVVERALAVLANTQVGAFHSRLDCQNAGFRNAVINDRERERERDKAMSPYDVHT